RPISERKATTASTVTPGGSRRFTPTSTRSRLPSRRVSIVWTFAVRERNGLAPRCASQNPRSRSTNASPSSTVVRAGDERWVLSPSKRATRLTLPLYPIVTPDHPLGSPTTRKSGRWRGIRYRAVRLGPVPEGPGDLDEPPDRDRLLPGGAIRVEEGPEHPDVIHCGAPSRGSRSRGPTARP